MTLSRDVILKINHLANGDAFFIFQDRISNGDAFFKDSFLVFMVFKFIISGAFTEMVQYSSKLHLRRW